MNRKVVFTLVVMALVVAFPASAASIITDGSFEDASLAGLYATYYATPIGAQLGPTMGGWIVSRQSVDMVNSTYWNAQDGAHSVDLNGQAQGAIRQAITLTQGQQYTLTFWLSANPDGTPNVKDMNVQVGEYVGGTFTGNTLTSPTFSATKGTGHVLSWYQQTWTFTALQNANMIQFSSQTPAFYGPVVDNISLDANVPEPGSVVLFGTLTAALALFVRRRRKA